MLELENALERIHARIPLPVSERISLLHAHNRILAETISAPIDLPPFDNSSMDGYAMQARDLAKATSEKPVSLKLIGRVAAGQRGDIPVSSGHCVRIFTGSPLPTGTDAVVMQEDTRVDTNDLGQIHFLDAPKPGENVRFRGEDVKQGTPVVPSGAVLTATRITLLAALGVSEISVGRRPIVGLLATGSELKECGQPLNPGQIYESNRAALKPLIERVGGIAKLYPIVPDEPTATRSALELAFSECDLVISCGGVSVGEMDFVKGVFEQLGGKLDFWKVAIKPGRPFVFGELGSKFLFGLPGNPVSAFVTFLLLTRPAILRWQGAADFSLQKVSGKLTEPLHNPGERRHFMRVNIDSDGKIVSSGVQASHALGSLAKANALLDLQPRATLPAGDMVTALRWD